MDVEVESIVMGIEEVLSSLASEGLVPPGVLPLDRERPVGESGLDSLALLHLTAAVERTFGLTQLGAITPDSSLVQLAEGLRSRLHEPGRVEVASPTGAVEIEERATLALQFNVMPWRPVSETLTTRRYAMLEDGSAICEFDREYRSSMRDSPDHLIFLSALVHLQKLMYFCLCHRLGLTYDPVAPERLKIWPTSVQIVMPELVTERRGLVQSVRIERMTQLSASRYFVTGRSQVASMEVLASALVIVLDEPT